MEQFFSLFAKSRISTLVVLSILCYTGIQLVLAAPELKSLPGIAGAVILCVAGVLSVIAFVDYRYKEHTDNAFTHLDKTIATLSRTLKSTTDTANAREKTTQETLKNEGTGRIIGQSGKRQYSLEGEEDTSTT